MPRGYYPTKHVFIIHNGDDAITTVQDIERVWRDLGPYDSDPLTWTICETDPSIQDSPLPHQYEHWILASAAEARRNTISTTVMVEVQWNTRSSTETKLVVPRTNVKCSAMEDYAALQRYIWNVDTTSR